MTITDDCKLPSKYYVIPASSQTENASAVVKVKMIFIMVARLFLQKM